jgi:hypothetical protein
VSTADIVAPAAAANTRTNAGHGDDWGCIEHAKFTREVDNKSQGSAARVKRGLEWNLVGREDTTAGDHAQRFHVPRSVILTRDRQMRSVPPASA